jgi:putative hydrolase of the HAD superfamily
MSPSLRGTISAVSFDGDGTLWNFEAAMGKALDQAAARFQAAGLQPPAGPVTASWLRAVRDDVARLPQARGQSMEQIRLQAFEAAAQQCGSTDAGFAREVFDRYMAARFDLLELYPDVEDGLRALHALGLQLLLVTNGNTHPHRVGLAELLPVAVVAFECGIAKPDPGIYRHAAERVGVAADRFLHIGDDPVEDVLAAQRAGMHAGWINRTGASWPVADQPDLTIASLADLPELL